MTWTLLDEMPIERPILLSSKRADSPLLYLSKIRSQTTNNYITKSAVRSSIKLILKQIFRRSYFTTVILFLSIAATATTASLHEFIIRDGKRDDAAGEFIQCPTWQPFKVGKSKLKAFQATIYYFVKGQFINLKTDVNLSALIFDWGGGAIEPLPNELLNCIVKIIKRKLASSSLTL